MNDFLLFKRVFFLIFFVFTVVGCSHSDLDNTLDDTPSVTPKFGPNFKFYNDPNLFTQYQQLRSSTNGNSFEITEVKKDAENLAIYIQYSGGCQEHSFDLVWDGLVGVSPVSKANILLVHKGIKDNCEALVSDTIIINLQTYFDSMIDGANTVFTVINGSSIQEIDSK